MGGRLISKCFNIILILIGISSLGTFILFFKNLQETTNDYKNYLMSPNNYEINHRKAYEQLVIESGHVLVKPNQYNQLKTNEINNLKCILPTNEALPCFKKENEIYVPFKLVRKKFDVNGVEDSNGAFRISFSYAREYLPNETYNSSGEYLWFSNVDVEPRERVKFISFKYGVPISSQWNSFGHLYPVQIGQFGLSHYSKWIQTTKMPISNSDSNVYNFVVKDNLKFLNHKTDQTICKSLPNGFEFNFKDKAIYKADYSFDMRYIMADISTNNYFELTVDLMLRDASLSVGNYLVRLIYVINSTTFDNQDIRETYIKYLNQDQTFNVIYYINGETFRNTSKFIRNICMDACKGLELTCENCLKPFDKLLIPNENSSDSRNLTNLYYKVYQISLKGEGLIQNATLRNQLSTPHLEFAKLAANYFIDTQNKQSGGWPVNVLRKFDKKSKIYLKPGWYSAMAQGHAISLLCRLYNHTNEKHYFDSAARALNVFDLDVRFGGVKAYYMNLTNLSWYEEYPTQPESLFVLNGFMYSMFGLYDFLNSCTNSQIEAIDPDVRDNQLKARSLFLNGLRSLNQIINHYDTGSRTFYDLRHLSNPSSNPNVARWDYHKLHVSQLFYLVNMTKQLKKSPLFKMSNEIKRADLLIKVAKRWSDYSNGIWNQNSQIKF